MAVGGREQELLSAVLLPSLYVYDLCVGPVNDITLDLMTSPCRPAGRPASAAATAAAAALSADATAAKGAAGDASAATAAAVSEQAQRGPG